MDCDEKLEQIFLLEILIDQVNLKDESIGTAEEPLRVKVKFIDFPCFEINQQEFATKDGAGGNFNSGKSCLFPMIPLELIRYLQRYPLAVTVLHVKEGVPVPDIIGQTRLRMTEGIIEAVQTVMNCSCDTDLPVTYTMKDTYTLSNARGDIGTICLFIRLSCFGQSIVTQFQLMGEKKAFLFKNSKEENIYPCKKHDSPSKTNEDPTKYDVLQASPFVSGEETAYDCGCEEEVTEGYSKQGNYPIQVKKESSEEENECECGFEELDLRRPQSPWVPSDCPYGGKLHKSLPKIKDSKNNNSRVCPESVRKQPERETEEDVCPCGFDDGDISSVKSASGGGNYKPEQRKDGDCLCGFEDGDILSTNSNGGGSKSNTQKPTAGEGDGGSLQELTSGENGGSDQLNRSSAESQASSRKGISYNKNVDIIDPKKGIKRLSKLSLKRRLQYPGVKVGHQECVVPGSQVPPNMGWLWKVPKNCADTGVLKRRKGWKPGAIGYTISKLIDQHRKAAVKRPSTAANRRKNRRGNGHGEVSTAPTLHVHRKDGAYYISMCPLDIIGDSEQVPLEFKIAKKVYEDDDAESSESDVEIEYMAPGSIEPKKVPVELRSFGSQYLAKDVAHLIKKDKDKSSKKKSKSSLKSSKSKGSLKTSKSKSSLKLSKTSSSESEQKIPSKKKK